jgi:hypothetical protein
MTKDWNGIDGDTICDTDIATCTQLLLSVKLAKSHSQLSTQGITFFYKNLPLNSTTYFIYLSMIRALEKFN